MAKRILIVDDDAMVRDSIEIILKVEGYQLEQVDGGVSALERYQPGKYDLVLTDNRMPGMSGLELAGKIKAQSPSQPVILFSGSPPMEHSGVCDLILLKPFSAPELRKAVARITSSEGPARITPLPG